MSAFILGMMTTALAHSPSISTVMIAESEEGQWIIQVRAALTAFEYEVHNRFGEGSYRTPEEFKYLVLEHLSDQVIITPNEDIALLLDEGEVMLGHETSVIYRVSDMPSDIEHLSVTNGAFRHTYRHQSSIVVAEQGVKPMQYKVNRDNNYHVEIHKNNAAFVATAEIKGSWFTSRSIVLISLLMLLGLLLIVVAQKARSRVRAEV